MRVVSVLIALLFLGCGQQVQPSPSPSVTPQPSLGEQVPLLTGRMIPLKRSDMPQLKGSVLEVVGCYTNSWAGVLKVDKTYGTSMVDEGGVGSSGPIMWPTGYTGYRVGSQVAVVDEHGTVVGVTGNRYIIIMGGLPDLDHIEPHVPGSLLACGPPIPAPPE
jgi:hypothetical protein